MENISGYKRFKARQYKKNREYGGSLDLTSTGFNSIARLAVDSINYEIKKDVDRHSNDLVKIGMAYRSKEYLAKYLATVENWKRYSDFRLDRRSLDYYELEGKLVKSGKIPDSSEDKVEAEM